MCNKEFEFLNLVDFGAFSVETVISSLQAQEFFAPDVSKDSSTVIKCMVNLVMRCLHMVDLVVSHLYIVNLGNELTSEEFYQNYVG